MSDLRERYRRRRKRTLVIVEGKETEYFLMQMLIKCFPELNVKIEDVVVYETTIYDLYKKIVKTYGDKWYCKNESIDIVKIVNNHKHPDPAIRKNDFTNIIMIFDYERHAKAPHRFDENVIRRMQKHFIKHSDDGLLYINYPMIEAYMDIDDIKQVPDINYLSRKIAVTCQPGNKYKKIVRGRSELLKYYRYYKDQRDYLKKVLCGSNDDITEEIMGHILEINSENNIYSDVISILDRYGIESEKKNRLGHYYDAVIRKSGYAAGGMTFFEYIRKCMLRIADMNIIKAYMVQKGISAYSSNIDPKECFEEIDLIKIVKLQNQLSRDKVTGSIWILASCMMYLAEYKFYKVDAR